jgi:hypothetical protein
MGQKPSDLIYEKDEFIAYQVDRAVMSFGIIIDNALMEQVEVSDNKTVQKYTLEQLLDENFLLPRNTEDSTEIEDVQGLMFDTV